MKKGLYYLVRINFFLLLLSFLAFILSFLGQRNPLSHLNYKAPAYDGKEQFNPALSRINGINMLEAYCDSLYHVTYPAETRTDAFRYGNIATAVVRNRFYWGYSCYTADKNYLALLFSHISNWGYDAIVRPDDILKYDYAACSQQSIVMMDLFARKGIPTRKVGFLGNSKIGHFAFEAFYEGDWHFYDPTLEPDTAVLNQYHRPGISFLVANRDILFKAYSSSTKDKAYVEDILTHYSYGKVNQFPAPVALFFHRSTKILSDTAYLFFLAAHILLTRIARRYKPGSIRAQLSPAC